MATTLENDQYTNHYLVAFDTKYKYFEDTCMRKLIACKNEHTVDRKLRSVKLAASKLLPRKLLRKDFVQFLISFLEYI